MLQLILKERTGYIIDLWWCYWGRTWCSSIGIIAAAHHFSIIHHLISGAKKQCQVSIFTPQWNRFQLFFRPKIHHHFKVCGETVLTTRNSIQISQFESQGWTVRKNGKIKSLKNLKKWKNWNAYLLLPKNPVWKYSLHIRIFSNLLAKSKLVCRAWKMEIMTSPSTLALTLRIASSSYDEKKASEA